MCREQLRAGHSVDAMSQAEMKAFIEEHNICLPHLRQAQLHRHPPVQPDVQDLPGGHRGRQERRSTSAPRPPRASLSTSRTSSAPPARSCPSACARSASPSAMRSPRATSPSAPVSLSRWSWSSSASRGPIWSGSPYWQQLLPRLAAEPGHEGREPAPAGPRPGGAVPTTPRPPPTLSSCSPSAGASCGAWPTAPTTT